MSGSGFQLCLEGASLEPADGQRGGGASELVRGAVGRGGADQLGWRWRPGWGLSRLQKVGSGAGRRGKSSARCGAHVNSGVSQREVTERQVRRETRGLSGEVQGLPPWSLVSPSFIRLWSRSPVHGSPCFLLVTRLMPGVEPARPDAWTGPLGAQGAPPFWHLRTHTALS